MSLSELAERCEKATGPEFAIDSEIESLVFDNHQGMMRSFTRSLDAALALLDARYWTAWELRSRNGLSRYVAEISRLDDDKDEEIISGHGRTAALALCAAALRALASCDTQPKAGDVKQAPLVSGAVAESETHKPSPDHPSEIPVE